MVRSETYCVKVAFMRWSGDEHFQMHGLHLQTFFVVDAQIHRQGYTKEEIELVQV